MGRFSLQSLINALVAGSVMLVVAQVVTTYIASSALGIKSELYKAYMEETVDFKREYARFAAQGVVAGFAFTR